MVFITRLWLLILLLGTGEARSSHSDASTAIYDHTSYIGQTDSGPFTRSSSASRLPPPHYQGSSSSGSFAEPPRYCQYLCEECGCHTAAPTTQTTTTTPRPTTRPTTPPTTAAPTGGDTAETQCWVKVLVTRDREGDYTVKFNFTGGPNDISQIERDGTVSAEKEERLGDCFRVYCDATRQMSVTVKLRRSRSLSKANEAAHTALNKAVYESQEACWKGLNAYLFQF